MTRPVRPDLNRPGGVDAIPARSTGGLSTVFQEEIGGMNAS